MKKESGGNLNTPLGLSFRRLNRQDKVDLIYEGNMVLSTKDWRSNSAARRMALAEAEGLGFMVVGVRDILKAMELIIEEEAIEIPKGRKGKRARGVLADRLLERIQVESSKGDGQIQILDRDGKVVNQLRRDSGDEADFELALGSDSMFYGKALGFLTDENFNDILLSPRRD